MPAFSIIIGFVFAMTYMRDNGFFSYEIFSINFMWVFLLVGMLLIAIHGFYILGAHLRITKKTDDEAAYITCIFINITLKVFVFLGCCCMLYNNVVFIYLIIFCFIVSIILFIIYCTCCRKKQECMKKIPWATEIIYIVIFITFFCFEGLQGVDPSFIVFAIFFFLFEALIIFISCAAITIERFFEEYPTPRLGSSVVICYSNALVRDYNDAIRHNYFEDINIPHVGDVIQIIRNSHIHELYNGDFAQITAVDEGIEIQSAPVWTTIGKEKKRANIELTFRNVGILTYDGRTLRCKIVDSLLHNSNHGLTPQETTALYINFRMHNPNLKSRSEVSQGLQEDPYFNALCVKYGYAITCHKAQGGEWPTVFVDYHGRTGLNDDSLRWSYTATTRASKILYGVLMPNMQLLDRLKINPITKVSKPQKDCIRVPCMGNIEDLPANATDSQKAKFLSVKTALSKLGLYINKVEFYQYVDRYYIQSSEGERIYNLQYNGMGMYTSVKALSLYPDDDIVQEALMSECEYFYDVCYSSEATSLMKLYHKMVSYCDDLGILITNITNAQYQVIYHLKTSGMFSSIHFFYNAKKLISYAAPLSDMGAEDEKLIQLIEKLRN